MRILFSRNPMAPSLVTIHFPCELPILVVAGRPNARGPGYRWQLSRVTPVANFAACLARGNVGKFSVELPQPRRSFRDFVEELIVVPGFVRLLHGDRYSLTIGVGCCFPTRAVCQAVADCVTRHFYPGETATVEPAPEGESRGPESEDPTVVATPSPQT